MYHSPLPQKVYLDQKKNSLFICPRHLQNMSELVSVCHLLAYALRAVRAQSTVLQDGLPSVSEVCEGLDSALEIMASA